VLLYINNKVYTVMRNLQPTEDVASGFQQGSSSIHYT